VFYMEECITSDDDDEAHSRVLHPCFERACRTLKIKLPGQWFRRAASRAERWFYRAVAHPRPGEKRFSGFTREPVNGLIR
jgi:hypothetical protein